MFQTWATNESLSSLAFDLQNQNTWKEDKIVEQSDESSNQTL